MIILSLLTADYKEKLKMKLTTMSRYGTRAVFDIAYNTTGLPVQVKDIAERQQIPLRYLEQIFHKLKKADFIKSERGPGRVCINQRSQ